MYGMGEMSNTGSGTTRRVIVDRGRTHIELERSHVDGFEIRLTTSIGSSGQILHLTEDEALRLATGLLSPFRKRPAPIVTNEFGVTPPVPCTCAMRSPR